MRSSRGTMVLALELAIAHQSGAYVTDRSTEQKPSNQGRRAEKDAAALAKAKAKRQRRQAKRLSVVRAKQGEQGGQ